jgi:hypothetical protein
MGDLSRTVLDELTLNTLCTHLKRTGFFGASSYYLNHAVNVEYSKSVVNGGVLDVPTLFIEAKYDGVCATALTSLSDPMRRYCRNLTQCSIEAGHVRIIDSLKSHPSLPTTLYCTLLSCTPFTPGVFPHSTDYSVCS